MNKQRINDLRPVWVQHEYEGPNILLDMRTLSTTLDYICAYRCDYFKCPFALGDRGYKEEFKCSFASGRIGNDRVVCTSVPARLSTRAHLPRIIEKLMAEEDDRLNQEEIAALGKIMKGGQNVARDT